MSDSLQPSFVTVDPLTGKIGANFAGHIKAAGVDLNAGTNANPPADDRIRWLDALGLVAGELITYRLGPGLDASSYLQAEGDATAPGGVIAYVRAADVATGTTMLIVERGVAPNNARVRAFFSDTGAIATILRSDNYSDYLRKGAVLGAGEIVNADVKAAAAIAYSKLALSGSIVDGDIAGPLGVAKLAGGALGDVLKTGVGPAVAWETPSRLTSLVDVVSTAAETTILSVSLGANVLGSSRAALVVLEGDFLNNTGAGQTIQPRVKLGATTLWDPNPSAGIGSNATRKGWRICFELQNLGATNSQGLAGLFGLSNVSAAAAGLGDLSVVGSAGTFAATFTGTSAEDTTAAKTLAVTMQLGASSASLSWRLRNALLVLA